VERTIQHGSAEMNISPYLPHILDILIDRESAYSLQTQVAHFR